MVNLQTALVQYTKAHYLLQKVYADELVGVKIDMKEKLTHIKSMKKMQQIYQEEHRRYADNEEYVVLDTFYEEGEFIGLFKILLDSVGTDNMEKKIAIETIARLREEEA